MEMKDLMRRSLDNYEQLEKAKDPTIVMSEYMTSHLSDICGNCGRKDTCPKSETECPGLLALISGVTARVATVSDMDYWVGVELDGTLTEEVDVNENYVLTIGKPHPRMVSFVKDLIEAGTKVKIFTPRVSPVEPRHAAAEKTIRKWTKEQFGVPLQSTCSRDYFCVMLISTKAKQVDPESGVLLESLLKKAYTDLSRARTALMMIDAKVNEFPKS